MHRKDLATNEERARRPGRCSSLGIITTDFADALSHSARSIQALLYRFNNSLAAMISASSYPD